MASEARFHRDASRKEDADLSFMHGSYLLEHFLKAKLKRSRSQILQLILNHYDFDQNNVKKKEECCRPSCAFHHLPSAIFEVAF